MVMKNRLNRKRVTFNDFSAASNSNITGIEKNADNIIVVNRAQFLILHKPRPIMHCKTEISRKAIVIVCETKCVKSVSRNTANDAAPNRYRSARQVMGIGRVMRLVFVAFA